MFYLSSAYVDKSYYSIPKGITNHFLLCRVTDNHPLTVFFLASIVVHVEHSNAMAGSP